MATHTLQLINLINHVSAISWHSGRVYQFVNTYTYTPISRMLQVVVLISCLVVVSGSSDDYGNFVCAVTENNPYLMFATKTAYDIVYERPKNNLHRHQTCEPVQIWLLARHGTRYPGRSTIRSMQQLEELRSTIVTNHDKKNGRLCAGDLDHLKVWSLNVSMSEQKQLTVQGKTDMYFLAQRFRHRFQSLFKTGYAATAYQFKHTNTERTRQSAAAFGEGLFGNGIRVWLPEPHENDPVIKPYSNCTAWQNLVRNNTEYMREFQLFRTGPEMSNLVHSVSERLGFQYDLASDTIHLMYDMCRYDKAWNLNARSAWCAVFTREELLVLEYLEDLKTFYEAGYGHEYNLRLGCTPIKDMIERFTLQVDDRIEWEKPNGIFYFTHSDMISMTLARLGIFTYGQPMRHDNYNEQRNRTWRSSNLTPFAANLAAVFYKCETGDYNRIKFFHNEKVVDYPGCNQGFCEWKDIRERFREITDSCNLDWCTSASPGTTHLSLLISIFTSFFLGIFN